MIQSLILEDLTQPLRWHLMYIIMRMLWLYSSIPRVMVAHYGSSLQTRKKTSTLPSSTRRFYTFPCGYLENMNCRSSEVIFASTHFWKFISFYLIL